MNTTTQPISAFDDVLKAYKPLVFQEVGIAVKLSDGGCLVQYDDLFQEALIAVWKCLQNYDVSRGVDFGPYLKIGLKNSLATYLRNRVPHHYVRNADDPEKFDHVRVYVESLDGKLRNG